MSCIPCPYTAVYHVTLDTQFAPTFIAAFSASPRKNTPKKYFEKILKKGLHFIKSCAIITELSARQWYALLAQLDRASGYGPEGQEFESLTACQKPTVF